MNGNGSAVRYQNVWWQLLLVFVLLLPLMLLFMSPDMRSSQMILIFALILIANLFLLWMASRRRRVAKAAEVPPVLPRPLAPEEVPAAIYEIMDVREAMVDDAVLIFRGQLRDASEAAFERLKVALAGQGTPLVQQDPTYGSAIFVAPAVAIPDEAERPVRWWVHWTLFALTLLTTTWAGAMQEGADVFTNPASLRLGLPYSIALLAILGFHELGHYFTARHYRINVTPPFFIPVPFALGTFGAFIQMRSAPEDRKSLFDVAVAGPFAGLVLAIPALIFGIKGSTVLPGVPENGYFDWGGLIGSKSILFIGIAKLCLGATYQAGSLLSLTPMAFAGLLGLTITAINLVPVGQLDGGHIARAMFGTRAGGWISRTAMLCLFIAAIVNPQYLFWAIIVFFIARRVSPPLNDVTPISTGRILLGALAFLILALILIPMPEFIWNALNHGVEPETMTL